MDGLTKSLTSTRFGSALTIAIIAAATIAGAWAFQLHGFAPCELCLKQRPAYYAGVPLAAVLAYVASGRGPQGVLTAGFLGLALIFVANSALGVYHAGVEWGWWVGPQDCTGALTAAPNVTDFLKELQATKVVRCDEVQLRILGLSLAGWNAIISAALAAVAARAINQSE